MHTLFVAESPESFPAVLREVLEQRGHSITNATSIEVAEARQATTPADLVIIDWASARPPIGERLRLATEGATTILLAIVRPETRDLEEAIDAGINDYLRLPLAHPTAEARIVLVERWMDLVHARSASVRSEGERLAMLDAELRTILDACPEPICMHQGRVIVYANPALAHSLGFAAPDELLGLATERFVHPDDRAIVEERLATLERTGLAMPLREERFVARDGSVRVGEAHSCIIRFGGGATIVTLGRDVTATRDLEARSRHSERLAAVGTIAASVAHELNNPLTLVLCNLADLSHTLPSLAACVPDELVARLGRRVHAMEDAALQMRSLARDLTDFVRAKEAATERVELRGVLERSVRMVGPYAHTQGSVILESALDDVGYVTSSETRLLQVFLNLLINAVDAVSEGPADRPHRISVSLRREGEEAVARVSDTGPGVPAELRSHIFEAFFSTKPRGSGTGLGLAVAKTVIENAGGTIALVDSEIGATFEARLPIVHG